MSQTVVAVFGSHAQAVHGVEELRKVGFRPDQISIFAPDPREVEGYADEVGVRVVQAGAAGLAAGSLLGLGGWLLGLTGLVIPGAGLIVAAGPVVAAILGAVGGASVGGFIGMLVGLGLPHHAAEEYHRELREGRTLVFVHPDERYALAEAALYRAHPVGLHHYDEAIGLAGEIQGREAGALADLAGHVEAAAPDASLNPADVAAAVEGQRTLGHTQYLDEADLRAQAGKKDI